MSQVIFALTMIALGIQGLITGHFAALWQPLDLNPPSHVLLPYLCALIALGCGIGLLWQRTEAAFALLVYFFAWLLLYRAPDFFSAASQDPWYGSAECAVYVAAAWVVCVQLSADRKVPRLFRPATGGVALCIARALYALAMIYFGVGHFRYFKETVELVPSWLPWHAGWAALTGAIYLVVGIAMLLGVYTREAAVLSAWQMAAFTLLVWLPILMSGASAYQRSESIVSWVLTVCGWVVADAYRRKENGPVRHPELFQGNG